MEAKHFAWFYLFEYGHFDVRCSYYGGLELLDAKDPDKDRFNRFNTDNFKAAKLERIKKIGIDWDKTSTPHSTLISQFQGTFCDSSHTEVIAGTLVLLDGSELKCTTVDSISVSQVFDIMKDTAKLVEKYKWSLN